MPLSTLTGAATATVKVPDLNATITAINAELATLNEKVGALDDLVARLDALETVPPPVIPPDLSDRVAALEAEPDPVLPPDLTAALAELAARVVALELLASNAAPAPILASPSIDVLPRPEGIDPGEVTLIYDKATLYYGDMTLHAIRLDERRWRLLARLNYIVLASTDWTFDEIKEGTPEEVYAHAQRRIMELAELKPQHDAVHERVVAMSEGR